MKEEFTTEMHADMLSIEESEQDMLLYGVYGAMKRLGSLDKALAEYGVQKQVFLDGIVAALGSKEEDREWIMDFIAMFQ